MQASPGEHRAYVWHPPGARLSVEIRLDVVDRIAAWTGAGLETDGRGIETGGLLLGRVRRARGLTIVEVADAEVVECEHAAGPSFMLSNADRTGLEAALRRRRGSVVGFFRSNTRREFTATIEDLALLASHFPDASQVMLLVDAPRGRELQAGFLFREGREIRTAIPYLIFPFASEWLPTVSAAASPTPTPVAAPAPSPAPVERTGRVPTNWLAAAAVVVGVVAGVWYESARSVAADRPPVAAVAPTTPVTPAAPPQPTPSAPEPSPEEDAEPEPSASLPSDAPPAPRLAPAPAPPVSADRAAPPEPAPGHRRFVPPAGKPRTAAPTVVADLPRIATPKAAAPSIAVAAAAPEPAPRPPAPAPIPTVESRVAVAVDPVPLHAGRFKPPETLRPSTPRNIHVDHAVVINVKVYLDRGGSVHYAELLSDGLGANRDLASAAVFSARKWRFSPATVNGKAVPAQAILRFRFEPETR